MFRKLTIKERFFFFLSITLMMSYGYQCYFNRQVQKDINLTLEDHNISVNKYVEMNGNLQKATEHWRAMYYASTTTNNQLEQQIEVINDYWKKECMKVRDELFDLKNESRKK